MNDAMRGLTARLAHYSATHSRRVIGLWGLAVIVSLGLTGALLHGLSATGYATGATQSTRAAAAIDRAFPAAARAASTDVVIISSTRLEARATPFRAFVSELAGEIRSTPRVTSVTSYLNGDAALVSRDGHAALIQLRAADGSAVAPVVARVQAANGRDGFAVAITGEESVAHDFNTLGQRDLEHAELAIGLPAALIVLVLVFGSLVAALMPLVLAILSILVGLGLVALLAQVFALSSFVTNMLTGMGLALGIDYCLFILSRYREERTRGYVKVDAITRAGASASRAVLFSGTTFVVSMVGMLLVPTSVMRSLAAAAMIVGVVSVLAALTLLPALLSVLGDRVNALPVPVLGRNLGRAESAESALWRRIVGGVLRRPGLSLAVTATLMLAAASPLLGLHVGASGVGSLPSSLPSKQGFTALQHAFPAGNPAPVTIVAVGGRPAAVEAGMRRLARSLSDSPEFGRPVLATARGATTTVLEAPVEGDPVGARAIAAVRAIRTRDVPRAFDGTGASVWVGGKTSQNIDYFNAVTRPTPYVLVFVLGMSLIVLLLAFRSLTVALVSIVLNLLSVGAAYGLLTLVFVHGVGASLFGFQSEPYIEAWVPLFLFSVLFGISMDYQVFLVSRIKEHHDNGEATVAAVAGGVASTARIITGAALIIVVVFAGFAAGQLVQFQQMGFGIAVALLLDATVIRSVVLPSLLSLLGERTWYLPAWLRWLPDLAPEGAPMTPSVRRTSQAVSPA